MLHPSYPTRGGKRGTGPKRKLSHPPRLRGEVGELTMSVPDEREAAENNQWRRTFRSDDWRGCGGATLPHVRERKRKLQWPPL